LLFKTGPCADSWRNYNQALEQWNQQYVKLQEQSAASQATAPLQQQISTLQQQIADQHQQITALQQQIPAAHTEGLLQGAGIGVGAFLILFAILFGINRLMGDFTVTKKPQTKAASA
jgi:hypothetical protein